MTSFVRFNVPNTGQQTLNIGGNRIIFYFDHLLETENSKQAFQIKGRYLRAVTLTLLDKAGYDVP